MHAIRYGIIGCGSMGREHIENLKAMGGATVTALADSHAASTAAALALFDGAAPQVFGDHRELLASGLCDAVVIATPNHTHIEVMRDALATSLHILVEKPLVTRMDDGVEMLRLARGRHGIVWVAHEYRYMPPVAEMIRMTHGGEVGRVHQIGRASCRERVYSSV